MKNNFFSLVLFITSIWVLSGDRALADYPIVSHRFLADPAVLVHDGRVYFYCSNDDENPLEGGYSMQTIVCVSSADLKNWTDHGVVLRVPNNAPWANLSWAPSAVERDGTFYLYFSNGASGIGVATATSPTGPFLDPIGRALVDASTPGASGPNMWLFDPYVFIDDDGQAYMYFGGNGESNVRIIRLNEDLVSTDGAAIAMTAPGFFEAAWMHKHNDIYYFSYSTDTQNGLRIDYMTSDNPTTGFTYGGVVAGQPPSNNNNNHHGIFEFQGEWYHVYHNRFVANQAGIPATYKRNLGLERLTHNPDGSIQQIVYTRDSLEQLVSFDPFQRVPAATIGRQEGIRTERSVEGGMAIRGMSNGSYVAVRGVEFSKQAAAFRARVAGQPGGHIEVRLDSPTGTLLTTCVVPDTGDLQGWTTVTAEVSDLPVGHVHDLYFVFSEGEGEDFLAFNWWQFHEEMPSPAGIPARPASLNATRSESGVHLSWAGDVDATGYRIVRSTGSGVHGGSVIAEVPGTAFSDTAIEAGESYYYKVSAFNTFGESGYSHSVVLDMIGLAPVVLEAEDAELGAWWIIGTDGDTTYVEAEQNFIGSSPDSADGVGTLEAIFPEPGHWELYARLRVGPDAFDDDSLFFANTFGEAPLGAAGSWVMINGLAAPVGYSDSEALVIEGGTVGSEEWKWVNLSRFGSGNPVLLDVPVAGVPLVFQFASREDGLRIDKFAFGREGVAFRVGDLDSGTAGAGITMGRPLWLGLYSLSDEWAMTGDWLGAYVYTGDHPWIWTAAGWMWLVEQSVSESGGWFYVPK